MLCKHMNLDIRGKLSAFWSKYVAIEFDAETLCPDIVHRHYFNLNTQNPKKYTRGKVRDALNLMEFSKFKYGVDPVLGPREQVEATIKYIIDNGETYVLANAEDRELMRARHIIAQQTKLFPKSREAELGR